MDLKPIPKHKNSVEILYEDIPAERFHCPFCGTETISYLNNQLEHTVCNHLICAYAEGIILTVSNVFLRHLKERVPTITFELAYDEGHVPWPNRAGEIVNVSTDNFCTIVLNSLTIRTFNTGNGEEVTVSYAPVVVGTAASKLNSSTPRVMH